MDSNYEKELKKLASQELIYRKWKNNSKVFAIIMFSIAALGLLGTAFMIMTDKSGEAAGMAVGALVAGTAFGIGDLILFSIFNSKHKSTLKRIEHIKKNGSSRPSSKKSTITNKAKDATRRVAKNVADRLS